MMKAAAASKAGTIHTSTYVKNPAQNHPCWVHSVLVMTYGERIVVPGALLIFPKNIITYMLARCILVQAGQDRLRVHSS